jgi:hypothetical protein
MPQATSINTTATVVKLNDYRRPPPKRKRAQSFYEMYPVPFFDRKHRNSWAAKRSGNYGDDCEAGKVFARQFLATYTVGWHSLLQVIVMDMIRAGPPPERWRDGKAHSDGLVIGFMSVISDYVMLGLHQFGPPRGAA